MISKKYGNQRVALVGFQPTFLEHQSKHFNTKAVDLDKDVIGQQKSDLNILQREKDIEYVLKWCDLAFVTGSTVVNGTLEKIRETLAEKPTIYYGIWISGVSEIMRLHWFCNRST